MKKPEEMNPLVSAFFAVNPKPAPPPEGGTPCSVISCRVRSSGFSRPRVRQSLRVGTADTPPPEGGTPCRFIFALAVVLGVLISGAARAFPPAPHHLFFGTVRDELGNPLAVDTAEVILETPSGTRHKASIIGGLQPGLNYKLAVPLDAGVTQDLFKPGALRTAVPFKIRVRIGQVMHLPIEMAGDFSKMGRPAEATRLDLTLGEDSDGDGLPDAWERALLLQLGGKASDVRPGDDSDGDGLSNLSEYLAGTYAFDKKDGFSLKVVQVHGAVPTLEFMAIRGRTYTVHWSSDLNEWAPAPFRFPSDGAEVADRQNYQATESRVVRISVRPSPEESSRRFFKLRVQ